MKIETQWNLRAMRPEQTNNGQGQRGRDRNGKRRRRFLPRLAAWMLAGALLGGGIPPVRAAEGGVTVYTDGLRYEGEVRVVNGRAYVSLREFACMADNAIVTWDEGLSRATVTTDALLLTAGVGDDYLVANGRYLWCSEGVFADGGVIYVPLQRAAQAFGFDNAWSFLENANYLTRRSGAIQPASAYYKEEDVYWLSRIIHAEAGGEPFAGKLAVGSVIMNRLTDEQFPDDLYSVIFDNDCGVQFTPTINGAIDNDPSEESVIAAKLCLDGYRVSDEILYFLNPDLAANFWVPDNCTFVMSIGAHDFYA